jgi:hypothetical protein
MSTVRFSEELNTRIINAARAKMNPALEKAKGAKPDNAWGQRIYNILFGDVRPVLTQLPAGWVKTVDAITIGKVAGRSCDMKFQFSTPQPWPAVFHEFEFAKHERTWCDEITLKDHSIWSEFEAEVMVYNDRVKAAETRQSDFVVMVNQVIKAYSTLAPALKAWPPLWDLIPEDVKTKHREVKERVKNEVVLTVDIAKLTAMSTAAKFGI